MTQTTTDSLTFPTTPSSDPTTWAAADVLGDLIHRGARQMLIAAVEAEVQQWIDHHAHLTDERGRRQVVRNGHAASRILVTGMVPTRRRAA